MGRTIVTEPGQVRKRAAASQAARDGSDFDAVYGPLLEARQAEWDAHWQAAQDTAQPPRLTLAQCVEVAEFLHGESYEVSRVRIGGRGWRDILRATDQERDDAPPSYLIEADADGCFVAHWARLGCTSHHYDGFGTEDRTQTRCWVTIAQALAAGTLWRGSYPLATDTAGVTYAAHAPQNEPCPYHGAATLETARQAASVCSAYSLIVTACLSCALERLDLDMALA